jgi:hypothetical protein
VLRADDTAVRVDADPEAPFLGIGVKRLQAKTENYAVKHPR